MRIASQFFRSLILSGIIFFTFGTVFAQNVEEESNKFDPKELINGHVWDTHEFHIADWNGQPITFGLPIILWTENGLTVFSSDRFEHDNSGTVVVEEKGQKFVRYQEHIFYADKFDKQKFEETSTLARPFMYEDRPLDFSITKAVFSMLLTVIILLLIFGFSARHYKKNQKAPKGLAGFIEPLILFVRNDIAIPNIGEKKYQKYMPLLLTIFFFIWLNNLIGLIPFFPFGGNVTGNIFFTMIMALFVFIVTIFSGNKHYWGHILNPPVPAPLKLLMAPIEIVGMLTKPFALMIRLFANITAGHIIILSLVGLIFIFESAFVSPVSILFILFMSVLELLVAALQAYVFTLLAALFIGQAVAEAEE